MSHKKLFSLFEECFPDYADKTKLFLKDGKNCIKVRLFTGEELIFTVYGPKHWKLEYIN